MAYGARLESVWAAKLSRGFESHPIRLFRRQDGRRFLFGAWLSQVERCVRDAEVPGSNPGAPTEEVPSLFTFLGINAPAEAHRVLSECCCSGALAEWYCTRLESERPKGLGGSNPSRSVFDETTLPVHLSREGFLLLHVSR